MDNLARNHHFTHTTQEYGKIVDQKDGFFSVETDSGLYWFRRAVSCLVEPEINDMVLVCLSSLGDGYILAVLERDQGTKTTLIFDADVEIKAPEGRLGITSREGLDLTSIGEVTMVSAGFGITAAYGNINIERLSFWGTLFEGSVSTIKLLADTFDSFLKRFCRRTEYSYRYVEEIDLVKSGSLNYQAEKSLQLRGKFSQITAKEDVHIDGERINIG